MERTRSDSTPQSAGAMTHEQLSSCVVDPLFYSYSYVNVNNLIQFQPLVLYFLRVSVSMLSIHYKTSFFFNTYTLNYEIFQPSRAICVVIGDHTQPGLPQ